eukprot:gene4119-4675_t
MQSSLDANNVILANLLDSKSTPSNSVHDDAQYFAAQPDKNTAALSVAHLDAQSVNFMGEPLPPAANMIRSSEEDAISLYGGGDFDQEDNYEPPVDNTELLHVIDNLLVLTDEAGPPLSEQLAKILNSKFQAEFDSSKKKELLNKYKIPSNCESFQVPKRTLIKRRELLRPNLSQEFKQACSRNVKIGHFLFGDDLPQTSFFRSEEDDELVSPAKPKSIPILTEVPQREDICEKLITTTVQ